MPASIIRQPDGKLARFSSVVDAFTHYGMTEQEAFEVCQEELSPHDAQEKVRRGVEDRLPYQNHRCGDGLARWRSALQDMVLNRRVDDAIKLLRKIGTYPEWETYMREYASKNGCNAEGEK